MRMKNLILSFVVLMTAWAEGATTVFPPEIKTVGVVMPASVLAKERFDRGVKALEKAGCRVKLAPRLSFEPRASAEDRTADFEEMWLDPEVDLVICARGGTGCEDVAARLDWEKLAKRPDQRFIGFSNVTVLLSALMKHGIGRLYTGPNLGTVGSARGDTLQWMIAAFTGAPLPATQLRAIRKGTFAGKSCGGHIGLVRKCINSGWFPCASNRVVFLERNHSTTVEGIRQELMRIAESGALAGAVGVVFGDVTPGAEVSKPGNWGEAKSFKDPHDLDAARARLELIKAEFAEKVGCPVYDGFVYGHIPIMHTVDFDRVARVDEDGVLTWE